MDENGNVIGFQFAARNANYRGVYLSLHNGYYIKVDGVQYKRDVQTFEINGKEPRTFEEIKTAVWEHWDYDDEGIVHVKKEGGLAPGKHQIDFSNQFLQHMDIFQRMKNGSNAHRNQEWEQDQIRQRIS